MTWRILISRDAKKFLEGDNFSIEEVNELIVKAIRRFQGEDIAVDIKKLKGKWQGFYRVRSGKMRVIAEFNFEDSAVFIEEVDYRGNVYK